MSDPSRGKYRSTTVEDEDDDDDVDDLDGESYTLYLFKRFDSPAI